MARKTGAEPQSCYMPALDSLEQGRPYSRVGYLCKTVHLPLFAPIVTGVITLGFPFAAILERYGREIPGAEIHVHLPARGGGHS